LSIHRWLANGTGELPCITIDSSSSCERLFLAPLTIEPMSTTVFSGGAVAHGFAAHP
jgi:hypothetical protein